MEGFDFSAVRAEFLTRLCEQLKEDGYHFEGGIFRKCRRGRLYILEADLCCLESENGQVLVPRVRVADARLVKRADGALTAGGILAEEADVDGVRAGDAETFYKTLRHLKSVPAQEPLEDAAMELLCREAALGAAVCENRAIPYEYRRRCRGDFPLGRALSIAILSGLVCFLLTTLSVGLLMGLAVYLSEGFSRVYGLFLRPGLYLAALAAALLYGAIAFRKARSGRF